MFRVSVAVRISLALASLTLTAVLIAHSSGLFPDTEAATRDARRSVCETLADECCVAARQNDLDTMRFMLGRAKARDKSMISAGVRRNDGKLVVNVGNHAEHWIGGDDLKSTYEQMKVPLYNRKHLWGVCEFCFEPLAGGTFFQILQSKPMRLTMFIAAASFLAFLCYLRRTLTYLNPSAVVPDRVRATLDTLAEGVLLLDTNERIVLANRVFAEKIGQQPDALQGREAGEIQFLEPRSLVPIEHRPWRTALDTNLPETGAMLSLSGNHESGARTFVVNSMPITGPDGRCRGALATFDDVTVVEEKNKQLENMLDSLQQSRDEIHRQNKELTFLATRDSLTGCLNRRAFFAELDALWQNARTSGENLSCIMVDVDHFKAVNDNHGHATGDQVLQAVAGILHAAAREGDLVCRYGGEEFCVVSPGIGADQAIAHAERFRQTIAGQKCAGLDLTASLGTSSLEFNAGEPRELLDQADKALYSSKRMGRNRVTCWRDLPPDFAMNTPKPSKHEQPETVDDSPIPFAAVTSLLSALAYRDVYTAEHSRRVADLCMAVARHLQLTERQKYVIEVGALLHDIGKLGVPDAILLKPGKLTSAEWEVMRAHDRMGVDILSAAFSDQTLTEIVRTHHARFDGHQDDADLPSGHDIPLGARILMIADAYDAMTSNRVYRTGRGRDEACVELRRCAGSQFDPELVEAFIQATDNYTPGEQRVTVPKKTALRIGAQIEQLAKALDDRDFTGLASAARRVAATASSEGVEPLVDIAAKLQRTALIDRDLVSIVEQTAELLELCRSTQSVYIAAFSPNRNQPTEPPS